MMQMLGGCKHLELVSGWSAFVSYVFPRFPKQKAGRCCSLQELSLWRSNETYQPWMIQTSANAHARIVHTRHSNLLAGYQILACLEHENTWKPNDTNTVYDGLSKCLLLVWLINRNSLRAASCLAFKTMIYLNSLKPCILSFMFEAVAKACSKC